MDPPHIHHKKDGVYHLSIVKKKKFYFLTNLQKKNTRNFSVSNLGTIMVCNGPSFLQKGRSMTNISTKIFARHVLNLLMNLAAQRTGLF
jgi:hypothetical protein